MSVEDEIKNLSDSEVVNLEAVARNMTKDHVTKNISKAAERERRKRNLKPVHSEQPYRIFRRRRTVTPVEMIDEPEGMAGELDAEQRTRRMYRLAAQGL